MAEWSNAPDSKSGVRFYRTVSSNLTLSASKSELPLEGSLDFLEDPHDTGINLIDTLLVRGFLGKSLTTGAIPNAFSMGVFRSTVEFQQENDNALHVNLGPTLPANFRGTEESTA